MRARETGEDRRHENPDVIVGDADPHRAFHFGFAQGRQRGVLQSQDAAGVVEQVLAGRGERAGAPVADKQRPRDLFLQSFHLHRNSRLSAADLIGGGRERPGLGDSDEGTQEVDIEVAMHAPT